MQCATKKQAAVETSVFSAEFVAMKVGIETLRGIRHKPRMMGVPIEGPTLHVEGTEETRMTDRLQTSAANHTGQQGPIAELQRMMFTMCWTNTDLCPHVRVLSDGSITELIF